MQEAFHQEKKQLNGQVECVPPNWYIDHHAYFKCEQSHFHNHTPAIHHQDVKRPKASHLIQLSVIFVATVDLVFEKPHTVP
jgi:hypothetical protein